MSLSHYDVFTVKCDVPDCSDQKTAAKESGLYEAGWSEEVAFRKSYWLCPFHVKELKDFLGVERGNV